MAGPKQVVFCTDGIFPHAVGGMQRHSALLIQELSRLNKYEIIVIHPHDKKVFSPELNVKEIALNFPVNGNYIYWCYQYSKKVFEQLQSYPRAVIYAQGLSMWHGIKKIGNRVIVNPHGLEPFQTFTVKEKLITAPFRKIERYLFKHAAKVVSLGGRLTDILKKEIPNSRNKIVVLPNAVNPCNYIKRNFKDDKIQLLYVGRFAFNKGINILLEAVRQLNNEGYQNKLQFNIVGKGPLYDAYTKQYSFSNVNFIGFAADDFLQQLYRENDLFVFPTLFEGMPTVVLEAMANAMPVIVSDTGATAELVNQDNGYLIESNNVRALKCAIQSFFQLNAADRSKRSENSYQKLMANFTWQVVAEKHAALFDTFNHHA